MNSTPPNSAPVICQKCGSPRFYAAHRLLACTACRRESEAKRRAIVGGAAALNRDWIERNREKYRAHKIVEWRVASGKLLKQPCERCGSVKAHAHHDDYSKPLDVMWLCPLHHKERHRELKNDGIGDGAAA
jgi:ribosomal protein S27AE